MVKVFITATRKLRVKVENNVGGKKQETHMTTDLTRNYLLA